ncbi:MAG: signal recognition particle-docking protein FtsY [archaeon]
MFGFLKKAFENFTKKAERVETKKGAQKPDLKPLPEPDQPKELAKLERKLGFLETVTKVITETKISDEYFDKIFAGLEAGLLQNNIASEIVEQIRQKLKTDLVGKNLKRGQAAEIIRSDLKEMILYALEGPKPVDLLAAVKENKPLVILFVGVNGVGKTTSIAKTAAYLQKNNLTCVLAASDTFRAASIEQLQEHADKLKVEVIKHNYGADPAAVAFDAVKHAKARGIDVVLIDTAGRQHSNVDLMAELEKIKRVAKPNLTILSVDALTGNDAVEQARLFNEKIGIDASIISKTDADEKGGAIISVVQATQKPILFIGTGQRYEDLEPFVAEKFVSKIFG